MPFQHIDRCSTLSFLLESEMEPSLHCFKYLLRQRTQDSLKKDQDSLTFRR